MYKKFRRIGAMALMVLMLTLGYSLFAAAAPAETRTAPLDLTAAASEVNAAQGWEWDSVDRVLTLSGINFEVAAFPGPNMFGMILPANTTIVLANGTTNTIRVADVPMTGTNIGISALGSLTITNESGSGTSGILNVASGQGINTYGIHNWMGSSHLTINAGTIDISAGNSTDTTFAGYSEGITFGSSITINDGHVTARAGNAPMQSYGINSGGTFVVGRDGAANASSPVVNAISGNSLGSIHGGSDSRLGHHAAGILAPEITFRNGTTTASGGTSANPASVTTAVWGWTSGINLAGEAYISAPTNGVLGTSAESRPTPVNAAVNDASGSSAVLNATITVPSDDITDGPDSAPMALTKTINAAPGVIIPESSFTFDFVMLERRTAAPEGLEIAADPAIPAWDITMEFAEGSAASQTIADVLGSRFTDGSIGAGIHYVRVTERANTNADIAADPDRNMDYDDSTFILVVVVANVEGSVAGTPGSTYVRNAFALVPTIIDHPTPGTPAPGDNIYQIERSTGENGDINYGGDNNEGKTDIEFENDYDVTITDEEDGALDFSKEVTGTGGDMVNSIFDFEATLTAPTQSHNTFLTDGAGTVTGTVINTTTGLPVVPARSVEVTFVNGVAVFDFQLRHNETLRFDTLPAGTRFEVREVQPGEYTGSASVRTNNVGSGVTYGTGNAGDDVIITGDYYVHQNGGNSADFVNSLDIPTVAGLVIGSMPFLFAAILALLVLAMMLAARQRQQIEELPAH